MITPQAWLVGAVVVISLLTACTLILYGAITGQGELTATGMTILFPILAAVGVNQIAKR